MRAGVLGATSLLLTTAAHVWGRGRLPAAPVLLVVGVLLGLGAAFRTRRRCRTVPLLVVLAVQRAGAHLPGGSGGALTGWLPVVVGAGGVLAVLALVAAVTAGVRRHRSPRTGSPAARPADLGSGAPAPTPPSPQRQEPHR